MVTLYYPRLYLLLNLGEELARQHLRKKQIILFILYLYINMN